MMASFAKVVRLLLLSQVMARKFKLRSTPSQAEQDEPAEYSASEATEKILAALAKVHGSMAEGQMRDLDKDEDGALSLAEFVDYLESDFKEDFYTADRDEDGKISVMELEAYNIWKRDGTSWPALMQMNASNSSEIADVNFTGAEDLNSSEAAELNASNSRVRTWWGDLCHSMYPPSRSFLMCYVRYGWVHSTCSTRRSSKRWRFPKARCIRNQLRISNTVHSRCYRARSIWSYRRCFGWQLIKRARLRSMRARLRSIDKIHKKCRRAGKFQNYRTCFHQKLNLTILNFGDADGNDSNNSAFMDGLTSLEEYDEDKMEPSEETKKETKERFDNLDENDDGHISQSYDEDKMEPSEETKKETKERFDNLDENDDGHISQSKGAKLIEESPTAEEQMQDLDKDEDGALSEEYDEDKMEPSEETKQETKERFDNLDENDDGHISQSKGAKLIEESPTAERQMQDLDKDNDGALSLAEFVGYLEFVFKEDFYTADTDHDGKISVAELEDHNNGGGMSLVALRQVDHLNSSGVAAMHSSEATIVNSSEAAELDDSNAGVRAWWRGMCKNMFPRRSLIRRKCYYRYRRVQFSCVRRWPRAKPKCFMDQMRISHKIHKKCRRKRNMRRYRRCFRRQINKRKRRLIRRARRLIIDKIHKSCRRFGNMMMYLKCLAKRAASNL